MVLVDHDDAPPLRTRWTTGDQRACGDMFRNPGVVWQLEKVGPVVRFVRTDDWRLVERVNVLLSIATSLFILGGST